MPPLLMHYQLPPSAVVNMEKSKDMMLSWKCIGRASNLQCHREKNDISERMMPEISFEG